MSDSENESYQSESEDYEKTPFGEEDSDFSDGEESLDPEQEPTFKPRIKIGPLVEDGELGADSSDEEDDDMEMDPENINDEEDDDEEEEEDEVDPPDAQQGLPGVQQGLIDLENLETGDDDSDDSSDDDRSDDEDYLQKLDRDVVDDYIGEMHPESKIHNFDEVRALSAVVRDNTGAVVDDLHQTIPVLTKYEKTKILGVRAKQLDAGAMPLVKVAPNVVDGYTIALMELQHKKIPFVIRRPLPNGACEYWKVSDLDLP